MGAKEPSNLVLNSSLSHKLQHFWKKYLSKPLRYASVLLILLCVGVVGIDRWVSWQASEQILTDQSQVGEFQVAVVLGTSKYLGKILNEYYTHRVEAAISLYDQGKVKNFLLSGDNAHRSYNEPWTMKRDLLRAGVPTENIYLDYAGFRTLDSIIRAKRIFETDNFLIISQQFHCERALFIANHHNINAQCLAVSGPTNSSGFKVRLREVFARTKAFLDLYIIHTQPRFLGPKEPIMIDDSHADGAQLIDNN
ncbi:SanA/YdcF family protein [Vibrio aestuarianus]|uniref:Protein SanA n=1 Tax=Vibrio aestuarianus TaxID=28171 RepID=A0ABN8TQI7_9VIBR|nr:ElyC/SanA/YdcF family protein [Vibrio aestuarianus]MDE1227880.1 YdcF family protein [Vibrio aestuarianus]MDE1256352.1 YdcF family protein [Vibrio aestuarianus]MDE1270988.1 YdcF family protein [Vibrio aestuarianus]MDE1292035.1 YdcF family protein [Vibrio aestuarianus]MDE1307002.1 YdcF family protein [Vibrio aestuarianus]